MAVVKVRASNHSNEIRQFEITDDGIVIGEPVLDYEGLLAGRPMWTPAFETVEQGEH
jgi:circadian clock protein KaiC